MPKRLVGGEYLLDLSSIELEQSEDGTTKTNITDADVIAQLTNLKKYVKNPEMAKPVWVKLYNGENDELVIARGTFAVVDTGEFEICVQLDGYKLVIYIEFTQVTLDDDTPIDDWFIDTNDAKYLFTSDAQNVKATIEDEDFGDVAFAGDLSVDGDLSVAGNISGVTEFENIKDAQGHNRFVEGAVTGELPEGITRLYGKWSLSGTHLMIVDVLSLANATEITSGLNCGEVELPQWVYDKIVGIIGNNGVDIKGFTAYDSSSQAQSVSSVLLQKIGDNKLRITKYSNLTLNSDKIVRINFDILIDNEQPVNP